VKHPITVTEHVAHGAYCACGVVWCNTPAAAAIPPSRLPSTCPKSFTRKATPPFVCSHCTFCRYIAEQTNELKKKDKQKTTNIKTNSASFANNAHFAAQIGNVFET
jgi:hypothetical protein